MPARASEVPRAADLTGQTFGRWLVLSRASNRASGSTTWNVRCGCGTERIVPRTNLVTGTSTQCKPCGAKQITRVEDLTGQTFGSRTVISRAPNRNDDTYWLTRCVCGAETEVRAGHLQAGRSRVCRLCSVAAKKTAAQSLIGRHYNTLVVIAPASEPDSWTLRCSCCGWAGNFHRKNVGPAAVCRPCRSAVLARRHRLHHAPSASA